MNEPTLDDVRAYAGKAWQTFTRECNLNARLEWSDTPAVGDGRLVSARVCGQGAAHALERFTADYHVVLRAPGDQRPQFDYSDSKRVACVWRASGVWIELWVSAGQTRERKPAPAPRPVQTSTDRPVPPVHVPRPSILSRASARLPYTRRRKETTIR